MLATGTEAQLPAGRPDTSQHFLWFTGHWSKTKKNMFVIGGSIPSGSSITVGGDGSVQISGPAVDAWNKRLDQALKSGQQYIQDLDNPQDNIVPETHQLHQLLEPDAKQQQQDLQDLKIDPKQNILDPGTKPGQSSPTTVNQVAAQYCPQVKADYDEVIGYWKTHAKDKDADLSYPAPPAVDYDCYACDSSLRDKAEQAVDKYVDDFYKEEREHAAKAFAILHQMGLFGLTNGSMDADTYNELFAANKKDPTKSAPCSYMSMDDLSRAALDITIHGYRRAEKMRHDNQKNWQASAAIIKTWATGARNVQLLGCSSGQMDAEFPELAALVGRGVEYYVEKIRQNDWRQIANLTFILSLMRQQALLGNDNDAAFQDFLKRLQRIWNGFKVTIEMAVKIGKDGGYRIAHVKGQGYVIPAFQRDSNQCYKWVVADENSMDILGFYKPSALQTIDCNLIDNEMITPPQAPRMTYVGTKFYKATLQNLDMDFCNPGHDTIVLSGFVPNPTTGGLWQVPMAGQVNLGVNGMDQFFENVEEKKKLADDGEAGHAADQMKQQAEQLKAQMETLKSQMSGPLSRESYEKIMEKFNQARSLSGSGAVAKMLWLDFVLPVKNNDPVLVDKKFDAKDINPQESSVIVYGYYTVHIENTGAGKTKSAPKK